MLRRSAASSPAADGACLYSAKSRSDGRPTGRRCTHARSSTATTTCRGRCGRAGYDFDAVDVAQPQPQLHTDLPRLRAGGVGGQFWSVFVPCSLAGDGAVTATLEQIDAVYLHDRALPRRPGAGDPRRRAATRRWPTAAGSPACWAPRAGTASTTRSACCATSTGSGVRYLTLTHNENTDWADSATDVAGARRADRLRPRGRRRDEPARHARRPVPRRRHHHARRAGRDGWRR